MADIKLGLYGTETTLPQVNSLIGSRSEMPIKYQKQINRETMLDGSTRFDSKAYHPRSFSLSWAQLPVADIATLITLANYNVKLHFLNEWISASWSWVAVTGFEYAPVTYLGIVLYRASLELEEVI